MIDIDILFTFQKFELCHLQVGDAEVNNSLRLDSNRLIDNLKFQKFNIQIRSNELRETANICSDP